MTHTPTIDLSTIKQIAGDFAKEIHQASRSQPSSVSYISLSPPKNPFLGSPKLIQALSIGGSNTESGIIHLYEDNLDIDTSESFDTPIFNSQDQLDQFILDHLSPKIPNIAINIAFPLESKDNHSLPDGTILAGTKEHPLSDLTDTLVGSRIANKLSQTSNFTYRISVANDVHCLVLAGISQSLSINQACLVLGTGTNTGFVHQGEIINLESAGFSQIPLTHTLKAIDANSHNPGQHLFEKATAGAYLHQFFNAQVESIDPQATIRSTRQLSHIANQPNHQYHQLAQEVLSYSAHLVSAQILGLYQFLNRPHLNLIIEGSLYWQGTSYQQTVMSNLLSLGLTDHIHISRIPQSNLVGAAQLFNPNLYYLLHQDESQT